MDFSAAQTRYGAAPLLPISINSASVCLRWQRAAAGARSKQPTRPPRRDATCSATDSSANAQPVLTVSSPVSVQQLEAASRDADTFAAVLQRLAQPGKGGRFTEAHVVAAWAAQRRNPALHPVPGSLQEVAALRALVALEELTRRQLVALTPDQLGFVCRCYVLAGGASKPFIKALQQAACSWQAEDYSAAGFAELIWAVASSSLSVSQGCRHLLQAGLAGEQHSNSQEDRLSRSQRQQPQVQPHQPGPGQELGNPQQVQQPFAAQQRDWKAWFEGTPASKVVLLLWGAGRLGCMPCEACMQAAAGALLRPDSGLALLPTKSLVTLLWALAALRADSQQALLRATTDLLYGRLQARLNVEQIEELGASPAADGTDDGHAPEVLARPPAEKPYTGDSSSSSTLGSLSGGSEEEGVLLFRGASTDKAMAGQEGRSSASSQCAGWPSDVGDVGSGGAAGSSSLATQLQPAEAAGGQEAASVTEGHPRGEDVPHTGMLSTVVWACGQLRHPQPRLLQVSAALLQERVEEMSPGDVARVLWGLAQLRQCPPQLLSAVATHLEQPGVLARFEVHHLAMSTYAFVALDFFPGQYCVDLIADACLAVRHDFGADPRALSNVLWNMSRLGHVDEPFYLAFVPVILPSIKRYGPAELADVARVYSRNGLNPEDDRASADGAADDGTLFGALARQTVARIAGADLQDVLRIMTAFHQMGLQPAELLEAVEGWANQRLRNLSPQALSLALWSFARMGSSSPKLLETAASCAEQQLDAFTPSQLAKVAWSLAKLRWPAARVLRHAGAQLAQRTAAFTDKDASNVLWALASEGETLPPEALNGIAINLQPRLKSFGPQSLANIAWAYTTMGHKPPQPFLHQLGEAAMSRLHAFEPQGLSLLVWSLASLGCSNDALFSGIVRLCCEHPGLLRQFEGQHLANLLWGLCRAGFQPSTPFLQDMAQEAELRVCDLKPQELFNIVWSFAQFGYHPAQLCDAVALEVVPRAFSFSPQELSGTLWALAKLGHATRSTDALLKALEREVAARAASFEPRHLAIVGWSAGQLGHVLQPAALAALLGAVRPAVLEARTLATLVDGLAAMERQRQRDQWQHPEQQQQPYDQGDHEESSATASTGGAVSCTAAMPPMVPPGLLTAMVKRAAELLPKLQPFEYAQLVHGFAVLGSPLAAQLFMRSPDSAARRALLAAVQRAPLPAVVGLLWAMARWGCYKAPGFPQLGERLQRTSPHYRFTQPALVVLGEALAAMPPQQVLALALRSGLQHAALAAAQQPPAEAADRSRVSGGDSMADARVASDKNKASENESGSSEQQHRRRVPILGGVVSSATVMQPPQLSDQTLPPLERSFEA